MTEYDTIALLKECDSGTRMAVSSFDEVMDRVRDPGMRELLRKSRRHHEELGDEIHALLDRHGKDPKDPGPVAKGMSWLKTNMTLAMDASDSAVAGLMTDGCDMGIKSLHQRLNQYPGADPKAKAMCRRLICIEEELERDLRSYL
ncbi:MAG: hypothetical protein Q4C82_02010 [Eubacteriales bacterium]|nr:hypothetical protein [Eubacteriales bacterium]